MKLIETLREPGYRRAVVLRRAAAATLLAAAALHALAGRASDPLVATFASPASAGDVLDEVDVELRRVPESAVPENAVRDPAEAVSQIVASPASAGEVITTTRLVGPDLARELVGDDAAEPYGMVPVALAEPDIIPMLRHGATVSVVTTAADGAQPATIATGGRVVLTGAEEGTVMLLLPNSQAAAVAAASLSSPLTVVLSGPPPS